MHLRRLVRFKPVQSALFALTTLLAPLPSIAQTPYSPQRPEVRFCPAQNRECATPAYYITAPPALPTFDSMDHDAAITRWESREEQPRRARYAAQSDYQYEHERPPRAMPDARDQSDLLKNSRDPDFILRNFKTMYVETRNIEFFQADQMKAALRRNPDFSQLHISIVEDRSVADVVLVVSYTFAWDYPFVLRHQNTTVVLLAGKGEGPLSGPLGAADVAREFVELAKPWRTSQAKSPPGH
ncbi:MAG TPA: hypothetical protein VKW06_14675 [Candidatus Angelobacter sp.]|nr:hypothetical protein [Candidatus Angelobacter sp.]